MTFEEKGIIIPSYVNSGQYYTVCPQCSNQRKKRDDRCLSVNLHEGIWYCHHCHWKGTLGDINKLMKEEIVPIEYEKPKLPNEIIKWFKTRGISQSVLKEEGIG